MTTRREPSETATPVASADDVRGVSILGQPVRITPEILEAAIVRAQRQRARAFEETIGALWRAVPRQQAAAAVA